MNDLLIKFIVHEAVLWAFGREIAAFYECASPERVRLLTELYERHGLRLRWEFVDDDTDWWTKKGLIETMAKKTKTVISVQLTKFNFYTEQNPSNSGSGWVGRCKELPHLEYRGAAGTGRDAALSGIKRLVKKMSVTSSQIVASTQKTAQPIVRRKENRIVFAIDRSGSMDGLERAVIRAFEQNVATLAEQERLTGQTTRVSVVTFDNQITTIRRHLTPNVTLSLNELRARGSTALHDAVAAAVNALESVPVDADVDVSYLVITMTDGGENGSRLHTNESIKSLIKARQATDRWTFTFLVPPGHSSYITRMYSVPDGNVQEWEASARGVQKYAAQNSAGLAGYYSMRSAGVNRSTTFYTDATKINQGVINQSNLSDVRSQVCTIDVKKVGEIRAICEGAGFRPYQPGTAFYQLQKREKVQGYKKLIIVDRTTGAVYAGDQARHLLGVPVTDQEVKIAPGANGNYDVYVQSTSVNRKMYPGSKVIVFT